MFSSGQEGNRLVIIYEDNGTGIEYNDKEKIFQRGVGKNTGLGLFVSRDILAITGSRSGRLVCREKVHGSRY